nr:FGGY-family carbohydrate kinase [uncultured Sphaerochaeta sp.]
MKYYLGLDNGGTTTKAALFDAEGNEIGICSKDTAMIAVRPGYTERDMEEMWEANCAVIKGVIEKTGISADDVAGVGICGHGKGLYLWGKDDRPVRYGIISTDNRAYEYPKKWAQDGTEQKVFELSCQHIMACQPVALLAWLKDNEPEAYTNIKYVFECKDYVRFRLTGEAKAEYTDYSGANFLNLHTRTYDDELLRLFGISEVHDALPPLCAATEIAGYVTEQAAKKCGLNSGTPVIGGMFDIDACALGTGITNEDNLCMIAGTWSINEYIRKEPVLDGSVAMNSLFALPEYFLIEESSPTSAGNNAWYINQMLPEFRKELVASGGNFYDEINSWIDEISPDTFVPVFLPFLMASNVHPNAKGSFIGITMNHTRKHLLRSVHEGICFCHRMHTERLMKSRKSDVKAIRLAGGAAHSRQWTQMFADVMQIPVETVKANETGALGCAIGVAAAVGDYASLDEAVGRMCKISARVIPNLAYKEIYDKKYKLYKKVINGLDSVWDEMQQMAEN